MYVHVYARTCMYKVASTLCGIHVHVHHCRCILKYLLYFLHCSPQLEEKAKHEKEKMADIARQQEKVRTTCTCTCTCIYVHVLLYIEHVHVHVCTTCTCTYRWTTCIYMYMHVVHTCTCICSTCT